MRMKYIINEKLTKGQLIGILISNGVDTLDNTEIMKEGIKKGAKEYVLTLENNQIPGRCKDCNYFKKAYTDEHGDCEMYGDEHDAEVKENHYCGYFEVKK